MYKTIFRVISNSSLTFQNLNFCKKVDKKLQIEKFIKKSFDFLKNGRLILEEDKILTVF